MVDWWSCRVFLHPLIPMNRQISCHQEGAQIQHSRQALLCSPGKILAAHYWALFQGKSPCSNIWHIVFTFRSTIANNTLNTWPTALARNIDQECTRPDNAWTNDKQTQHRSYPLPFWFHSFWSWNTSTPIRRAVQWRESERPYALTHTHVWRQASSVKRQTRQCW